MVYLVFELHISLSLQCRVVVEDHTGREEGRECSARVLHIHLWNENMLFSYGWVCWVLCELGLVSALYQV